MMRQSCRDFVDDVVIPFIRNDWRREWSVTPEERLPPGNPPGRAEGRYPLPRRAGGVRWRRARQGERDRDLRAHRRGDRARQFGPLRQAGANLEGFGAAAQPRAAPSPGALVPAHRRGPAVPARALPDRAARRVRPLAALQRAGSRHADPRGEGRQFSRSRFARQPTARRSGASKRRTPSASDSRSPDAYRSAISIRPACRKRAEESDIRASMPPAEARSPIAQAKAWA